MSTNGQTIYAYASSYQRHSRTHSRKCAWHKREHFKFPKFSFFLCLPHKLSLSHPQCICEDDTTLLVPGEISCDSITVAGGATTSFPTQTTDTHHRVILSKTQYRLTSLSSQGTLTQAETPVPQMLLRLSFNPTAVSHSHLLHDAIQTKLTSNRRR